MPDGSRLCCVGCRRQRKHANDEDNSTQLGGETNGETNDAAETGNTPLDSIKPQAVDDDSTESARPLVDAVKPAEGGKATATGHMKILLSLVMVAVALSAIGCCIYAVFVYQTSPGTTSTTTTSTMTMTTTASTSTLSTTTTDQCHAIAETPAHACAGPLRVDGYGVVQAVRASINVHGHPAAPATVRNCSNLAPKITSRMYFGEACTPGYTNTNYVAMNLLGRSFSYTINLAGAKCGCVAALYLVNMHQNTHPGICAGDHYCDANKVCGVACAEVDIMEANRLIWKTTLHRKGDPAGKHSQISHPRYGPGSHCINTNLAFQVKATVYGNGGTVHVMLSQGACTVSVPPVHYHGLLFAFKAGMTPVVSYWHPVRGESMKWFDGAVCSHYNYNLCSQTVHLSNFAVSPPIKANLPVAVDV